MIAIHRNAVLQMAKMLCDILVNYGQVTSL